MPSRMICEDVGSSRAAPAAAVSCVLPRSLCQRKEKPMSALRTEYFITLDTHCRSSDACVKTARGKLVKRVHLATGIPQLRELIESVPRPRRVAFEEGS